MGFVLLALQLASCDISIGCGAGGVPVRLTLPVIVPSSPLGAKVLAVVSPPPPPSSAVSFFPPQAKLRARRETVNVIASQKRARFFNIMFESSKLKINY